VGRQGQHLAAQQTTKATDEIEKWNTATDTRQGYPKQQKYFGVKAGEVKQ
jgi:hypothetical protein